MALPDDNGATLAEIRSHIGPNPDDPAVTVVWDRHEDVVLTALEILETRLAAATDPASPADFTLTGDVRVNKAKNLELLVAKVDELRGWRDADAAGVPRESWVPGAVTLNRQPLCRTGRNR